MIIKFNIFLLIKNQHAITSSLTYRYNGRSREEERWSLQLTQKMILEDTEFSCAAKNQLTALAHAPCEPPIAIQLHAPMTSNTCQPLREKQTLFRQPVFISCHRRTHASIQNSGGISRRNIETGVCRLKASLHSLYFTWEMNLAIDPKTLINPK